MLYAPPVMKMTFPARDGISLTGLKYLTPAIAALVARSVRIRIPALNGTKRRMIELVD